MDCNYFFNSGVFNSGIISVHLAILQVYKVLYILAIIVIARIAQQLLLPFLLQNQNLPISSHD